MSIKPLLSFDFITTPLGVVTYFWSELGIESVRLLPCPPQGKPCPFFDLTLQLDAFFKGRQVNFSHYPLNMSSLSPSDQRVLKVVRSIPYGETSSYGDIALQIGHIGHAQAVGQALKRNPFPLIIPCHRVKAQNDVGGYSFGEGRPDKFFLQELERGQQYLF